MGDSSDAAAGKVSPVDTGNIPGRVAYLRALNAEWPEVLEELRDDVAPKYADLWKDMPAAPSNSLSLSFIENEIKILAKIKDEINSNPYWRRWMRTFAIKDEWILDAALETISWNYSSKDTTAGWFWLYVPETRNPVFSPTFDHNLWIPSEPWASFGKRIRAQISGQLSQYRRDCNRRTGTSKPELKRDAIWTVRYQKGVLAREMAEELREGYEEPEQAVYRAIDRFAKSIGLTLRNHRRTPE